MAIKIITITSKIFYLGILYIRDKKGEINANSKHQFNTK